MNSIRSIKNNFDVLIFNYIEVLFPILTAIDMYRFSTNLLKFMDIKKHAQLSKRKKHCKLIKKINDITIDFLLNKIEKILNDPNLLDLESFKKYANLEIINSCFSEFIVMSQYGGEWKNSEFKKSIDNGEKKIIDVKYIHNKLKYSLDAHEDFPPSIQCIKYLDGDNITTNKKGEEILKNIRKEIENKKRKNLDTINIISQRHKEKYF